MNEFPKDRASDSALCPRCGRPGRDISAVTVQSLVTEQAKARLKSTIGFCFCATPKCGVAYFQPASGECVLQEELRLVVFQKSADPKRLVCYCYGHTVIAIQSEVRASGFSRILEDIKDKCAQGLDQCNRTNPQGSCCLGNVQRVIREAVGRNSLPPSGGSCGCCR
jgi:Zinc binding domain